MSSSSGMKLGGAPSWLGPLLGARFFQRCAVHPRLAKNECNHYCLSCAGEENAVCCPMCLSGHRDHHVLQIRRSSYKNSVVIRVAELEEVADMSLVQPYVVNHERVMYLNPRPQAPQHAIMCFSPAGAYLMCGRKLVDEIFRFCSLGCKLEGMVSDPNLTFILDPECKLEYSDSDSTGEEDDGGHLPGPSNFQPIGGTSYRRQPRKGVCGPPQQSPFY
ncbi:protein RGF1 INDUCIBLE TRANSCRIPTION FACTOR 1-like [Aegilops tauschii subsp. strangulata]|nr:protein RGF1 INDUCIBLE TRANSCRIPTION FACTOR 1-like [Aegilops tauschii subsp. strangulata]